MILYISLSQNSGHAPWWKESCKKLLALIENILGDDGPHRSLQYVSGSYLCFRTGFLSLQGIKNKLECQEEIQSMSSAHNFSSAHQNLLSVHLGQF